MKVSDIYRAVRLCYDEEAHPASDLSAAPTDDITLMNNIIRAHIGDALRWVCLYAPAEQLSGGSSEASGASQAINLIVDASGPVPSDGRISLGSDFIRLIRVRCSDWHRAVMADSLLREDSDEYLQLMDSYGAEATLDRPQAALIESAVKLVEVWPHPTTPTEPTEPTEPTSTYSLTKLVMPSSSDIDDADGDTPIVIPPLVRSSFLYYLAFLTLSAYEDSRAPRMLEIARLNLGLTNDKQRA